MRYKIEEGLNLNKLVKQGNSEFIYQHPVNKASVYKINDGRYIAYPAVGSKGIIVSNLETMKKILDNRFPIENLNNPFENNQDELTLVPKENDKYFRRLSEVLKIDSNELNLSTKSIEILNKAIKKYGLKNTYDSLFIPLGIYVGEILKSKKNGEWSFIQKYGYNPFKIPVVITSEEEFDPWYKIAHSLIIRKRFDLKYILEVNHGCKMDDPKE